MYACIRCALGSRVAWLLMAMAAAVSPQATTPPKRNYLEFDNTTFIKLSMYGRHAQRAAQACKH
eukprot:scaffold11503_cov115-Isochrysis_galbana.AAC.2